MLAAKFFEYLPNGNFSSFSIGHILFIVLGIIFVVLFGFLLRNLERKTMDKIMKILACTMPLFDIVFWIWELIVTKTINIKSSLPLYYCSLFYMTLPFAAFCKNEFVKQTCLAYLATMNAIAGLMGLIINTNLSYYPVFSFVGLRTMLYHITMLFVSSLIWFTKYYKPKILDTITFVIPILIMFIPAYIVDIYAKADYLYLNGGINTPIEIISSKIPHILYIFTLLVTIILVVNIIFYIPTIINYIKSKRQQKSNQ